MSIHNDDRQYGSDEERSEWKREVKDEYRREGGFDDDVCEWLGANGKCPMTAMRTLAALIYAKRNRPSH